jgi:hypothetical protein
MKHHLLLFLIIALAIAMISCSEENHDGVGDSYDPTEITEHRAMKDKMFKEEAESPIPETERAAFKGLHYYEPSEAYVIDATFEPFAKPDTITMPTSVAGDTRRAVRVGTLSFEANGTACKLVAYRLAGQSEQELFVPFTDKTTGDETYGAGRYLDIEVVSTEDSYPVELDFNMAYHPYCAYNERYSCPVVPRENALPVAIKAGERNAP